MQYVPIIFKPHIAFSSQMFDMLNNLRHLGKIVAIKTVKLDQYQVDSLYAHHKEKDYWKRIVEAMTEGPSVVVCIKGNHCELRKWALEQRQIYRVLDNKAYNYVHCTDIYAEPLYELDILMPEWQKEYV